MKKILKIIINIMILILLVVATSFLFSWLFEPPITYVLSVICGILLSSLIIKMVERITRQ